MARAFFLAVALAALTATVAAADWPHWRGPDRTGTSREADLPTTWSADDNVAWKLPLPGVSGSTPIVWGDHVFLNVADGGALYLWAVDRNDGSLLWKRQLDDEDEAKRKGNMSSPSPVTDGTGVWVMTGTGVLTAFDLAGEKLWSRELQADYGAFGILHGYSSSPLLHGDALYVQVLHGYYTDDPSYVLAVDKRTGKTLWRVERPTDAPKEAPDAYTTPALLERGDGAELVISGADYVTGHDLETGEELWRVGGLNPTKNPMGRIVASPIVAGAMIYVPSRVKPLLALEAKASGAPEVVWSTDEGPDVPTPALAGNRLYILRDNGVLLVLDAASGETVWGPERLPSAVYSASPLVADGKLYATTEQGKTVVVSAGAELEILAENDVDEYTLSSLAVDDGQLFLRTAKHLYCIGEKAHVDTAAGR